MTRAEAIVAIAATFLAVAVTWLVGERTVWSLAVAVLAWTGAAAAGFLSVRQPVAALGVLFLLASASRLTLETPVGTMRPEQPAIAVVCAAILVSRPKLSSAEKRALLPIVAAVALYVAVTALSSMLVAPEPFRSLRFNFWTAVSLVSGAAAYFLARSAPAATQAWFVLAGVLAGGVAIACAILFFFLGPGFDLGIQISRDLVTKAFALSWEANLHASFLAAMTPFAVEYFRRRPSWMTALALAVVVLGFALGLTRGAYLGFVAGLLLYFAVTWSAQSARASVVSLALVAGFLLAAAPLASALLPNGRAVTDELRPTLGEVIGLRSYSDSAGPSESVQGTADPADEEEIIPGGADTIRYRLDRIGVALRELQASPLIGLGADSYGQRHAQPDNLDQRDHLGVLAVQLVYDSGVLGALAFVVAMALICWRLLRAAVRFADESQRGLAAAYLGSIAALLVAYQATNAIHFAHNWLLVGAALALIHRPHDLGEASTRTSSDSRLAANYDRR